MDNYFKINNLHSVWKINFWNLNSLNECYTNMILPKDKPNWSNLFFSFVFFKLSWSSLPQNLLAIIVENFSFKSVSMIAWKHLCKSILKKKKNVWLTFTYYVNTYSYTRTFLWERKAKRVYKVLSLSWFCQICRVPKSALLLMIKNDLCSLYILRYWKH